MKTIDLISSSLRLIGVLASGETPSSAEAADSLVIFNQMVEAWGIEHLALFTLNRDTFTLVPGTQNYTVGTGGTFNMTRPARIEYISMVILNNPAQPLELPIQMFTDTEWQAIPVKSITTTIPQGVYDDGGFPLRTLSYFPVPTVANQTILGTWAALTQAATLATDLVFPPGYFKAARYNLAVDLAPEFGASIRPEVLAQALASKGALKSLNSEDVISRVDPAITATGGSRFNWLIGR